MKAIWIILIVLVFVALAGLILLTFVGWQPITDQTKSFASDAGAFIKNIPATLYAGIAGAFSAIVAVGKTISNKLNSAKSATVKAQTEYKNLKTSTDKVMTEDVKVIQAKEEAITSLTKEKDLATTKAKELEGTVESQKQTLHDKEVAMQAVAEHKLALFHNTLPTDSVVTDEVGNTIKTVTKIKVK